MSPEFSEAVRKSNVGEPIDRAAEDRLFRSVHLFLCIVVLIYVPLYVYFEAYFPAVVLAASLILFSPIIYVLRKTNHSDLSRILFIISCNFYVFLFSLGMGHDGDAENYCIPTMMLGLLLFDTHRLRMILGVAALSLLNWALITWIELFPFPTELFHSHLPVYLVSKLNFLGAFAITGSFFTIFVRATNLHRLNAVRASEKAKESIEGMLAVKTLSEEKLQLIVESMQEGLVIMSGRGEILEVNKVSRDMSAIPELGQVSQPLDMIPERFIWPDGRDIANEDLPATICLVTNQPVLGRVLGFVRATGEIRWLRVNSVPISLPSEGKDIPFEDRRVLSTFTDISDLVKAQMELEEFFKISTDFLCVSTIEGRFTRVNPSLVNCLGYTQADYDVLTPDQLIHPEDMSIAMATFERISQGQENQTFIVRTRSKWGEYRRISWVLNGRLETGVIYSTGRDITAEHEDRENARIISEEKNSLANLLEQTQKVARMGSWSLNIVKDETTWSKQMYEMFEIDPNALALNEKTFFPLIHPDDKEKMLSELSRLATDDVVHKFRFSCLLGDRIIWVECITQGIRGGDGSIVTVSGTCQDVTERVNKDEQHTFVLDALGIGIWSVDVESGEISWDERMYRIYGMRPEDYPRANDGWAKAVSSEDSVEIWADIDRAISGEKDFDMTFKITTPAGEQKHLLSRGFNISNAQGTVTRVMGVNWDRSKEVELENTLLAERVKMINSAKMASLGEMSAGIAHEINNPLAIIVGKTERLTRIVDRPETTVEMLRTDFNDIKKTAFRIAALIKGLRTFSRNSENDPFAPAAVDVLITDTTGFCKERFSNSSVNLIVTDLPSIEFDARATQVSQVLLNLLNNAFDAVNGSKEPWIKIEVQVYKERNTVQFIVTDSGPGIPQAVADKIMNPFFTTKEVGKGTGLGLSISQGMAQDHGGSLKLDMQSKNTRFVLELPLHHPKKAVA